MRLFGHLSLILIVSTYQKRDAKHRLLPEIEDPIFAAGTYVGRYIARERKINHDHRAARAAGAGRPPHANKTPTIDQQDEEVREHRRFEERKRLLT